MNKFYENWRDYQKQLLTEAVGENVNKKILDYIMNEIKAKPASFFQNLPVNPGFPNTPKVVFTPADVIKFKHGGRHPVGSNLFRKFPNLTRIEVEFVSTKYSFVKVGGTAFPLGHVPEWRGKGGRQGRTYTQYDLERIKSLNPGDGRLRLQIYINPEELSRVGPKAYFSVLRNRIMFTLQHEIVHFWQAIHGRLRVPHSATTRGHLGVTDPKFGPKRFVYELLEDEFEANFRAAVTESKITGRPFIEVFDEHIERVIKRSSWAIKKITLGEYAKLPPPKVVRGVRGLPDILAPDAAWTEDAQGLRRAMAQHQEQGYVVDTRRQVKIRNKIRANIRRVFRERAEEYARVWFAGGPGVNVFQQLERPDPQLKNALLQNKSTWGKAKPYVAGGALFFLSALDLHLRLQARGPFSTLTTEDKTGAVLEWGRDMAIWGAIGAASVAAVGAASPGIAAGMIISCLIDPACKPPKSRKEKYKEKIEDEKAAQRAAERSGYKVNPRGFVPGMRKGSTIANPIRENKKPVRKISILIEKNKGKT